MLQPFAQIMQDGSCRDYFRIPYHVQWVLLMAMEPHVCTDVLTYRRWSFDVLRQMNMISEMVGSILPLLTVSLQGPRTRSK